MPGFDFLSSSKNFLSSGSISPRIYLSIDSNIKRSSISYCKFVLLIVMAKEYLFQTHQTFVFLILRIIRIRISKFPGNLRHVLFSDVITLQQFFARLPRCCKACSIISKSCVLCSYISISSSVAIDSVHWPDRPENRALFTQVF